MNPAVAAIEPSLIRILHEKKRPGDLDLGLGEAHFLPDVELFRAATAWVAENGCPYTPNAGDVELREAVAAFHQARGAGVCRGAENVLITHGSQEALYLALKALIDPREGEVLIPAPAYGAYAKVCALEGIRHHLVPMDPADGFTPRAAPILAALTPQTRLILLASPCNPTSRVWSHAEARRLVEGLAAQPHPVWLLVDEVYRSLVYTEDAARFGELTPHLLLAGGLSKSHALTGLRLGWLMGPKHAIDVAARVHQQVTTAASTFSQRVAVEVFRRPESFDESAALWRTRRDQMVHALDAAGLEHAPLEGSFYAWARLPDAWAHRSQDAVLRLLDEQRVVTIPGSAFGPAGEGWVRLSFAGDPDRLAEGVARVARGLLE